MKKLWRERQQKLPVKHIRMENNEILNFNAVKCPFKELLMPCFLQKLLEVIYHYCLD